MMGRNEITDAEVNRTHVNDDLAEVHLEQESDDRIDNVLCQCSDDVGKCAGNNDTNGHVHDISL